MKKNLRVLVLGKSGQLATQFRALSNHDANFEYVPKEIISNSNPTELEALIANFRPNTVINCCAYTRVDKAETDREICFQLNTKFASDLAKISSTLKFHFIHFSTDYVFDGRAQDAYTEQAVPNPINYYGQTKLDAEREISQHAENATIVRTAWIYSEHAQNFLKTMMRIGSQSPVVRVVDDQIGNPTWAFELASVVRDRLLMPTPGVSTYHYSSEGQTSWFEFAAQIFKLWNLRTRVEPITTVSLRLAAERPRYSSLDKSLIKSTHNLQIETWSECLEKLHHRKPSVDAFL